MSVVVVVAVIVVPRDMHVCYVNGWQSKVRSFACFRPLLCVDAAFVVVVVVVISVAYSQTITFTHQPHMVCVCVCVSLYTVHTFECAMQLPMCTIPHGIFSFRFSCGRHRHHCCCCCCCCCCSHYFFFIFSFHFSFDFTYTFRVYVFFSHLIFGKWPCGKYRMNILECIFVFIRFLYVC